MAVLGMIVGGGCTLFMIVGTYVFCWTQDVQVRIWDRRLTAHDHRMARLLRIDIG